MTTASRLDWRLRVLLDDQFVGAAVAIAPDLALCCAHQVLQPERSTSLAVVDADGLSHWAQIEKSFPDPDIAILRLTDPPAAIRPARLSTDVKLGATVSAYGYPRGYDHGLWTRGVVLGAIGEQLQIEGFDAGPGFSGAGVMNEAEEIVGILTRFDRGRRSALMIPVGTIANYWPSLRVLIDAAGPVAPAPTAATPNYPNYPGYVPDSSDGEDLLGRTREIEAMAALLTAQQTVPPLSVGLFGDWGTGKSFFMDKLRQEIDYLALMSKAARDAGQPTAMCAEVRQIVFNAWHYTDAHLWPSLVSAIFLGLAQPKVGETKVQAQARWTEERQRLALTLETTRSQVDDGRTRLAVAKSEVDRLNGALSTLEARRMKERDSLTGLSAVAQAVRQDSVVQAQVAKVRERFELEQGTELAEIKRLAADGLSASRRLTRIWQLMRTGERRRFVWLFTVATVAGVASCAALLWFFSDLVAGVLALVAPVAVAATPIAKRLLQGLGVIETAAAAAAAAEEDARAKLDQEKEAILADLSTFDAQQAVLRQEIVSAEGRVQEAERALRDASTGRLLADFITERSASNDYRSQLGVIATIRRDFEQLAGLMALIPEGEQGPPPIERIVLYIDDLDRCAPDRVVEVLQAINLLLGLPLFVAVIAVDARWLESSLELHFERVLGARPGPDGNRSHWSASPMNYLEKIIQIPYNLAPMDDDNFARLLGNLFAPGTVAAGMSAPSGPQAVTTRAAMTPGGTAGAANAAITLSASALQRLSPGALNVSEPETVFASKLYPLVRTPRAAKRLANLYRLIRASLPPESLRLLVEEDAHEVVLLLLALLVGKPAEAARVFGEAMLAGDDDSIDLALSKSYKVSAVKPWVPIVSRHSFHGTPPLT